MDSLHLFTIPKWLPNTLLPEIWAIIFYWKWQLEIIDIQNKLLDKLLFRYSKPIWEKDIFVNETIISGNKYRIFQLDKQDISQGKSGMFGDAYRENNFIIVPKCGIELLDQQFWYAPYCPNLIGPPLKRRPCKGNKTEFKKYLSKNHGIVFQETDSKVNSPFTNEWKEDWNNMIKLLRTI